MKGPSQAQAGAFIRQVCRLYGPGIGPEDLEMEGWAGYLEACRTYRAHAGRYTFWEYAFLTIRDHLDTLRQAEARRRKVESTLSLDSAPLGDGPAIGAWLPTCQGDFVNTLQLRDYLSRLPGDEKAVAWGYINREPEDEICAAHAFSPARFTAVRARLAVHLQEYLAA